MSIVTYIKDKLGVKHEIGAKWDNVSGKPSTFAPSAHNHNASDINAGTLPIARGGTGATTRIGAEYNLLNGVESMDATLEDARLFPIKNNTVSASNGVFRWYSLSRLWSYFRTKLGISSAVGSTTNPVYVDSNGQLKAVGGIMLKQGSLIDTHSEGSRTVLIDGTNELFAFYDRGGTCTAYEYDLEWNSSSPAPAGTFSPADLSSHKTTASVANISANVFNSLTGYNQSTVYSGTKYAVYDLKLPASFSYATAFYWSFGNSNWKPHYFEVLVWKDNATQYPNGYISKYRSTSVVTYGSVSVDVGAEQGHTFTHIRIVMDKYSRLAAFGIVNYSSAGLATNYMSRTVDKSLYRDITVAKNNTYNLGSSSAKWANIYATNFNGALKGNADTASNCNYSGKADANTLVVKRTNASGGAFIQYLPNNQTENWWRTGSVQDSSKFVFNYKGTDKAFIDTNGAYNGDVKGNASTASAAKSGSALETAINGKADAASVTGATKCKVTYNGQGVITAGADLDASDIPNLAASKITSGTFADERIASASKWNAKQDALTFDTTPTESSSNPVTSAGVKSYVDSAVTGLYKYRGSVNTDYINALQNPLNGDVYNINTSGTITNGEGGQPMSVLAGDNVAFVLDPITSTTYWDKMSSELDLSNFVDFDDIATATTAGVVKSSSTNGKVSVDASGVMTVNGWSGKQNTLTEMTPEEVTNLIGALKEYGSTYINE